MAALAALDYQAAVQRGTLQEYLRHLVTRADLPPPP
jgi:hypothetical protein